MSGSGFVGVGFKGFDYDVSSLGILNKIYSGKFIINQLKYFFKKIIFIKNLVN